MSSGSTLGIVSQAPSGMTAMSRAPNAIVNIWWRPIPPGMLSNWFFCQCVLLEASQIKTSLVKHATSLSIFLALALFLAPEDGSRKRGKTVKLFESIVQCYLWGHDLASNGFGTLPKSKCTLIYIIQMTFETTIPESTCVCTQKQCSVLVVVKNCSAHFIAVGSRYLQRILSRIPYRYRNQLIIKSADWGRSSEDLQTWIVVGRRRHYYGHTNLHACFFILPARLTLQKPFRIPAICTCEFHRLFAQCMRMFPFPTINLEAFRKGTSLYSCRKVQDDISNFVLPCHLLLCTQLDLLTCSF